MEKRITIKDVALLSGYSVATVSHVLNKNYPVSEESNKKIRRAMDQLGYQPNLIAGSMRNKNTKTIGLIIPDISNPFFADLAKCIEHELSKEEYHVIISCSYYDIEREKRSIDMFISRMVDGILISPTTIEGKHLIKLKKNRISCVIIDREIQNTNFDTVKIDGFKGMYDAVTKFIEAGHKEFAYIDRNTDHSHSLERKQGFKQAILDKCLSFDDDLIVRSGFTYKDSAEAMELLLSKKKNFTVLVTFMDVFAIAAIKVMQSKGIRVPRDVSVISFGDSNLAEYISPSLSTIHYPMEKVSHISCEILINRIRAPNFRKKKMEILPVSLIERESTNLS